MAIQFDKLPTESGFSVKADVYKAHIDEAVMRKGKDPAKPAYLSLKYTLTTHEGKKAGIMFDGQYESESQVVQYKLGRFLTACGIPLVGTMELKDIAALVLNKEIVVDTVVDESGKQPRLQVDPFGREAYYPIGQFDEIWKLAHPDEAGDSVPAATESTNFMNIPEGVDEEADY